MIRTTAVPRTLRVGAAVVGVAGAVALAGCSAADSPATADTNGKGSSSTGGTTYTDGTYTAQGSYVTPQSIEKLSVTVTLAHDVITAVDVTGDPQKPESREYQAQFIGGIAGAVVGKDIDQISVSRVAGSSLTSGGFNQAIEAIKSEATG